jgi:hypothetical protein
VIVVAFSSEDGDEGSASAVPQAREALLRKYTELSRLRRESTTTPPTLALRALAREFPGALREIDRLSHDEIERRIRVLQTEPTDAPMEPALRAVHLFHVHMRELLFAKTWLRGQRTITKELRARFLVAAATRPGAACWAEALEQIARPPNGRLVVIACAKVAAQLGVSNETAHALVFSESAPCP